MKPIGGIRHGLSDERLRAVREGHVKVVGEIVLESRFAAGLVDIERFSHLYVLWVFDRSEGFSLSVRPPMDRRPHGVFATRSPRRPNPIGLTLVELLGREGARLRVRGLDMFDGSPVLDLKPCTTAIDEAELRRGWLDDIKPGP